MAELTATTDGQQAWDRMVERKRVDPECPTCLREKPYILAHGYSSGGPAHPPNAWCKSGGRPHCTCDACY